MNEEKKKKIKREKGWNYGGKTRTGEKHKNWEAVRFMLEKQKMVRKWKKVWSYVHLKVDPIITVLEILAVSCRVEWQSWWGWSTYLGLLASVSFPWIPGALVGKTQNRNRRIYKERTKNKGNRGDSPWSQVITLCEINCRRKEYNSEIKK